MLRALLSVALLVGAAPVAAITSSNGGIPNPTYTNGFDVTDFTVVNGVDVTTRSAHQSFTGPVMATDPSFALAVGASPTPFVIAKAHGGNGVDASGGGSITYFFAVNGPNRQIVPLTAHIIINAVVGGSAGSVESDSGVVNVFTDLTHVSQTASASYGGTAAATHMMVNDVVGFTASANITQYDQVQVIGAATIAEKPGQQGYANLYADPFIMIDPTWAATHPGYSLKFSAGIGNLPGPTLVPEPATWTMMLAGFGLAGGALRRRRHQSVAASR